MSEMSETEQGGRPAVRPPAAAWAEAIAATAAIEAAPECLLGDLLKQQASTRGDGAALLSDRETLTFADLARRIDHWAGWAAARGLAKGDRVALVMSNRPEFVAVWLGLSQMGVVTALINTQLQGAALRHCLQLANPRAVIMEPQFAASVSSSIEGLSPAPDLVLHDGAGMEGVSHCAGRPAVSINDPALLIYTSGTTGLPKAALVSHRRILNWALWFKGLLGNSETDRMYNCLPLYHSVGGVVAVAATLAAGGSTVIAERFSARGFWADLRRWNCTQIQYIGELCRYLLATAPQPDERTHAVRVACGNGLRADIWEAFRERFAIPQIVEFYAATEGSFSLFNVEGKIGAIGRIPSYLRHRFPTALVKHDLETGLPLRGDDGFCIRVAAEEPGEAIGRVSTGEAGSGRFEGYTDARESERKLLRDVFKPGDAWFRTGDLMRMDAAGFYYFVDRIGDTFRWKGENVSTLEVANLLSGIPGVADVTVYGVAVPDTDGRAGMAYLHAMSSFDIKVFQSEAEKRLPAYAVPLFVRIGDDAFAVTETFKHKKSDLQRQGFDPASTGDRIYVKLENGYERIDDRLHARILAGQIRF